MKLLALGAALAVVLFGDATLPTAPQDLANAPIYHVGPTLLGTSVFHTVADVVNDSLRVVVMWGHPSDGLGNEDSTLFRIKASKPIRFMGGGTAAADQWKNRMGRTARTADTFKVAMPALGDSIMWQADSIRQCRMNACSVPGSAGWGYLRSAAPPAMTFIRIATDSF